MWECGGGGGREGRLTHCGEAAAGDCLGALPSTRVDEEDKERVEVEVVAIAIAIAIAGEPLQLQLQIIIIIISLCYKDLLTILNIDYVIKIFPPFLNVNCV